MAGPGDELVDVIDGSDTVIRQATRAEVRADHLRHRAVFVVVLSSDGGFLLTHRRAHWKDVWPGRFDLGFGGVLGAGESYVDGAHRELAEEAGVSGVELQLIAEGSYDDGTVREHAQVFVTRTTGPFTFSDGEVISTEWVPLGVVERWIDDHDVCSDSVALVGPLLGALYAAADPPTDLPIPP